MVKKEKKIVSIKKSQTLSGVGDGKKIVLWSGFVIIVGLVVLFALIFSRLNVMYSDSRMSTPAKVDFYSSRVDMSALEAVVVDINNRKFY